MIGAVVEKNDAPGEGASKKHHSVEGGVICNMQHTILV